MSFQLSGQTGRFLAALIFFSIKLKYATIGSQHVLLLMNHLVPGKFENLKSCEPLNSDLSAEMRKNNLYLSTTSWASLVVFVREVL